MRIKTSKTRHTIFSFGIIIALFISACSKFEEINTDPDASTKASRSLLATNIILGLTSSSNGKPFYASFLVSKYLAWAENSDGNQYNAFDRTGFTGYSSVINGNKMLSMTSETNRPAYEGLYLFNKAYNMFYLSMSLGDIPYSEAFQGESNILKPKYDSQKQVMIQVLDDLEKSYDAFNKGINLEGDPLFKGDSNKWRKIVRAFQLKVLIQLSNKSEDSDLKVKEKFKQYITADLMTSNTDNLQRVYSENAKEFYPIYKTRLNHNPYAMLSDLLVNKLKETGDYRLFYYGRPAASKIKQNLPSNSFDSFIGVDPSAKFDVILAAWGNGEFSGINDRYTQNPSGEPVVKIGYAEQQFILAEAVLRGWISGSASDYYKEGIKASMSFIASRTPDNPAYHYNRKITDDNINSVIASPTNQLNGNKEGDLEKIMVQKYLASFMNREWETYYDYRRTGYPKFPINPLTNQNSDNTKMPMRWKYPLGEYDNNSENITEAVQRQWNGVDDVNKLMWILQK
ncbi:SusD/RagB family nutrient-binding outer membrane lipoprotein [Sphingobacterium sp. DK4209]|uniref:SusD/RagB family nutrient-binding outer membrane lipoprotein n=1 Tax=Sphingobacterium zhuxiongii TaxID=2662364 RepID=A0A5Q0Q865_9SPHI|nr:MULTISPECIES: SusD/RagB family nutrient-binding outer membrane lipoprotein [unclassified Sphingobacterium]MVZ64226.1 SusD/RagB family nutrient-binding outer membrane lipoprotein [Sphingobacterium sp. DK4209]QGA25576.1 SusD/RagB family nutrient-binding outer membrane lipoprotein [Sphingobacterium sp. dk4302]